MVHEVDPRGGVDGLLEALADSYVEALIPNGGAIPARIVRATARPVCHWPAGDAPRGGLAMCFNDHQPGDDTGIGGRDHLCSARFPMRFRAHEVHICPPDLGATACVTKTA